MFLRATIFVLSTIRGASHARSAKTGLKNVIRVLMPVKQLISSLEVTSDLEFCRSHKQTYSEAANLFCFTLRNHFTVCGVVYMTK